MQLFTISDIHADYHENLQWVRDISQSTFRGDALIVAGDISHRQSLTEEVLTELRSRFAMVFYVPGNHDLWLRSTEASDSLEKLHIIIERCRALDVKTGPAAVGAPDDEHRAHVVPLLSWYERPEESTASLFIEKPGEDQSLAMWVDNWSIRWPDSMNDSGAATTLLELNAPAVVATYDSPVISFSHFVPRRELMFPTMEALAAHKGPMTDPAPRFNFSRVAGSTRIDDQLRETGSMLHVYGHQHRNRHLCIDGVHYLSSCLGYPKERSRGSVKGIGTVPKLIWDSQRRISLEPETLALETLALSRK